MWFKVIDSFSIDRLKSFIGLGLEGAWQRENERAKIKSKEICEEEKITVEERRKRMRVRERERKRCWWITMLIRFVVTSDDSRSKEVLLIRITFSLARRASTVTWFLPIYLFRCEHVDVYIYIFSFSNTLVELTSFFECKPCFSLISCQ